MNKRPSHTAKGALDEALAECIAILGCVVVEILAVVIALLGWYGVDLVKGLVGPKVADRTIFSYLAVGAQFTIGGIFTLQFIRTVIVQVGRIAEASRATWAAIWPPKPAAVHAFRGPITVLDGRDGDDIRRDTQLEPVAVRPSDTPGGDKP